MTEGKEPPRSREVRDKRWFKVNRQVRYPANDADDTAIRRGDTKAHWEAHECHEGDIVNDIPAGSVGWLIENGTIEEVDRPPTRVVRQKEVDE